MADDQSEQQTGGSISDAIIGKVLESVKNMDVPTVLQKMVESSTDDPQSQDAKSKLQNILDKYNTMTEDERESFSEQLKTVLATKMAARLQDKLGGFDDQLMGQIMNRVYLVIAGVALLIFLIVFFGYKLYKSIKDKELKREEKKKAKQLKKKK